MRQAAVKIALLAASVVAALALAEGILRAAGFAFEITPQAVEFGWPDPVVLKEHYAGDPDLFWVLKDYDLRLRRFAPGELDLVFMGDSCTEFSEYPRLLLERLRADHPEREIVGLKLAVGGWSSYQGLEQMRRDVVSLRPGAVAVQYGWNDHWIGFGVEDKEVHRLTRWPVARFREARLAQLVFKARLAWRARRSGDPPKRVSASDFEGNLREIVGLARQHGIVPVLLTAPTSHRPGREPAGVGERWLRDRRELVPLHRAYAAIVRRVAESERAVLCDLAAAFDGVPEEQRDEHFWDDGIHLSWEGTRKVSELLYDCFRRSEELRALWDLPEPAASRSEAAPRGSAPLVSLSPRRDR
jgi:lysophospholipase L1-like esterase